MERSDILIVGAGLAAITLVRELRKRDSASTVTVVTADDGHFYSKPMLSNGLAAGKTAAALVMTPRETLESQLKIVIRARTRVVALKPEVHKVLIDQGDQGELTYGKLVLALGAQPIRLPIEGDGAADVLSVNHIDDYARYREKLEGKRSVALLGAGLIGCEFANDLRSAGLAVEVYDIAPQPLGRLLPTEAGSLYRQGLEAAGVHFHFGVGIKTVERTMMEGAAYRLTDSSGAVSEVDLVVSAVGLKPETALAAAAGLAVNRGIVTGADLQTSVADVYALGDCVEVDGSVLPFVLPIMHQAKALAATLNGTPTAVAYPAMPVVVKTPACPAVVCPPAPGLAGEWKTVAGDDNIEAVFRDGEGRLAGFALVGSEAVKAKQSLAAQLA
ncbi:MAG TPA: FAD-dependent oxidoreductase [Rhodocyclaceae bacterium]|jgi:rubredoxin-NAD+ reductase|nr:FAD-dependent oxidoreductase [Rhodocyclaceae bacterium]